MSMDLPPPAYISSPTYYVQQAPEVYQGDDVVLHLSYNILVPQENEDRKRATCLWMNAKNSEFPFKTKEEIIFLRNYAAIGPMNAISGPFSFIIEDEMQKGKSTTEAAEIAFEYVETVIAPRYLQRAEELEAFENATNDPELKEAYRALKESLIKCGTNPRDALKNFYTRRIFTYKDDKEMLDLLLQGSMGRHPMDPNSINPLRACDYWQQRKLSFFQTIEKTRQLAPNAPYIIALQEVISRTLVDFKEHFASDEVTIISYNNGAMKKTDEPLTESEAHHKDSFTSTIIFSKDYEVIREELEILPDVSKCPRRILGVEVKNIKTGKHLAVFSTHTDHIPSQQLYIDTAAKIHEFVGRFIKKNGEEVLPFVFSGDLNAFPDQPAATDFIANLRNGGPFVGCTDYRESSSFHTPAAIAHSTFIGQAIDDFKSLISKEGTVQPNALDHSFISAGLKSVWGLRDAGVYDDSGNYVDPYANPELYIECLKKRQTASDHFLSAFIFKV